MLCLFYSKYLKLFSNACRYLLTHYETPSNTSLIKCSTCFNCYKESRCLYVGEFPGNFFTLIVKRAVVTEIGATQYGDTKHLLIKYVPGCTVLYSTSTYYHNGEVRSTRTV